MHSLISLIAPWYKSNMYHVVTMTTAPFHSEHLVCWIPHTWQSQFKFTFSNKVLCDSISLYAETTST